MGEESSVLSVLSWVQFGNGTMRSFTFQNATHSRPVLNVKITQSQNKFGQRRETVEMQSVTTQTYRLLSKTENLQPSRSPLSLYSSQTGNLLHPSGPEAGGEAAPGWDTNTRSRQGSCWTHSVVLYPSLTSTHPPHPSYTLTVCCTSWHLNST